MSAAKPRNDASILTKLWVPSATQHRLSPRLLRCSRAAQASKEERPQWCRSRAVALRGSALGRAPQGDGDRTTLASKSLRNRTTGFDGGAPLVPLGFHEGRRIVWRPPLRCDQRRGHLFELLAQPLALH